MSKTRLRHDNLDTLSGRDFDLVSDGTVSLMAQSFLGIMNHEDRSKIPTIGVKIDDIPHMRLHSFYKVDYYIVIMLYLIKAFEIDLKLLL